MVTVYRVTGTAQGIEYIIFFLYMTRLTHHFHLKQNM